MSARDNRAVGARADRAGKGFEAALEFVHLRYANQRRAFIVKNATAGRFVRRGGELVFAARKSLPDYVGVLSSTGRAVVFDAKTTSHRQGWKLDERRLHQARAILDWSLAGALGFFLVECRPLEAAFAILPPDIPVWGWRDDWRPSIAFDLNLEPGLVVRVPIEDGVVDWLSAFAERGVRL